MKDEPIYERSTNKIVGELSTSLNDNIKKYERLFNHCDDIVKRKISLGENHKLELYISYIDVMVDRKIIEQSVIEVFQRNLVLHSDKSWLKNKGPMEWMKEYGIASADIREVETLEECCQGVLAGDTLLIISNTNRAILLATRGWPNRGVNEPDTEAVIRGPKEGFNEVFRFNTVLIRRRIRDTKLKVIQRTVGTRSRTDIGIMYLEDVVRPNILQEILDKLDDFMIDGIYETGMLEQFLDMKWHSPFPMTQVTQRPDKAASAIMEGRVAIVVDNTPFVLLLPTTINCFYQAAEDNYSNWLLTSFIRCLRYVAVFLALSIPGLYIAITNFHPEMIPTGLAYSITAARSGVPFPTVVEVLIMELEFELLREAGVRLPVQIGNTIGIVGGLIIGQAAVSANLVSPIIVVIVSLTAIASFAIPSHSLAGAYRIIKYIIIFMSALLGLYGFWLGILLICIHVVSIKSYGIPYLFPYVMGDINQYNDVKDSFIRLPLFAYKKRPIFAKGNTTRLRIKKKQKEFKV